VHFERLVIENEETSFTFDLHQQLTVIGPVSQLERDGLINEIVGALGDGRSGVHLELESNAGQRFAVFRPSGAKHRVVDVDAAVDVTAQFSDENGTIDLLSRAGMDARTARGLMRFGPADMVTTRERDRIVQRLARVNQNELWVSAEALRQANRRLDEEAEAMGSAPEDAAAIARIEERHAEFEDQQTHLEAARRRTFILSGFSGLLIIPATLLIGLMAAVPLMVLALASVLWSMIAWRKTEKARGREEEALAEAGAASYLGFHLQRVNGLLSSDQARKRMMKAAEEQRDALQRWKIIAGEVELDWALTHRDDIAAAVKLRQDVVSIGMNKSSEDDGDRMTALAHAVIGRLNELRTLGPGGETFPALLDDPFAGVEEALKPSLLELLVRASEHQQVVLCTEDESILEWARLEAMTGALGMVEPQADHAETEEVAEPVDITAL